jgi:hypothetical protein
MADCKRCGDRTGTPGAELICIYPMDLTLFFILVATIDELQRSLEGYMSTIEHIRQENIELKCLACFDAETGDVTSIEDFMQRRYD